MDRPQVSASEMQGPLDLPARELRIAGLLSLLIALPYVSDIMPVEQEVAAWGAFSVCLGVLLLIVSRAQKARAAAWLAWTVLIFLVLMQVLPIILWLLLGVTTDSPWIERGIATRVVFAVAHTAVLVAGLVATVAMARARTSRTDVVMAALTVALLAAALLNVWPH